MHVDKELYGDVFRRPPKLTPLEARAIRLAIEYVGPTIAADADTPLDRVRKKLEETFGQFELAPAEASSAGDDEEALVRTLSDGAEKRRLVELEYLKEGEEEPTTRLVEPYTIERELPFWRVHTWDRTVDGPRTYRLDRMRSAQLTRERFEPREGFDPNYLSEPAVARLWHAPPIARWKLERGARRADRQVGDRGRDVQDGGVAALRGARRPWRDGRARAGHHASRRRRAGAGAPVRARAQPAAGSGRQSQPEPRPRLRAGHEHERAAVRLGDRASQPEPEARATRPRSRHARRDPAPERLPARRR